MNAQALDRLFTQALEMYERGLNDRCIELLVRVLGDDPDHADAHAVLALALVERKRLHAGALEAARALQLEPMSPLAHLAMAATDIARRRFAQAETHLLHALELDPQSTSALRLGARLYWLWQRPETAWDYVERACRLAPGDPGQWALRAMLAFDKGDRDTARHDAKRALAMDPENIEALTTLGHCALAAGNIEEARTHAVWALSLAPDDPRAHVLMAGVKARSSLLLGLWWRFQSFITAGSNRRAITLLVGIYLVYRAVGVALDTEGLGPWSRALDFAWLGFCAYTWFAPTIFRRSLEREFSTVRLRRDY